MKTHHIKTTFVVFGILSLISFKVVSQSAIDQYILQKMDQFDIPGVAVSYIKDGKIAIARGYGHANIKQDITFTPNTIIEIASITKVITSTAAMQLWEQGLFELDDPINNYLDFQINNPFFPTDPITFRMLLNHSSSINFGLTLVDGVEQQPSVLPGQGEPLETFLQSHLLPGGSHYVDTVAFQNFKPGYGYSYSNFAMATLAYLVEEITGIPFHEYCDQNIFEPLCMNSTACHYAKLDTTIVARSYTGGPNPVDYPLWEWSEYPGFGIKSTALDVSKFMLMHLNYGILDGARIIDSTTEAEMRTAQFVVLENGLIPHNGIFVPIQQAQCLGMDRITEYNNNNLQIFGKSGQDKGLCMRSYFVPDENSVVTAFANFAVGDGINLPLIDILLELHFIDQDSLQTTGKPSLDCSTKPLCQQTKDYWNTHQDEWTIHSAPMRLGNTYVYSKSQVIDLFNTTVDNDAAIVLAQELAAAKINIAQGSELAPILATVNEAMALIGDNAIPFDEPVEFSSDTGELMLELAMTLRDYNEAKLNENACDEGTSTSISYVSKKELGSVILKTYPNPAEALTTISFTLPAEERVHIDILDSRGLIVEDVTDALYPAGDHELPWDASRLVSGVYLVRMSTGSFVLTEKMAITR